MLLPPKRPLTDWLIWVPAALYAVFFLIELLNPPWQAGGPFGYLVVLGAFLLLAMANESQSRRISRLEAELVARRKP